ncbi:MAG: SusC/RagA family TonB-linked outer membrane protein, partial [Bacteroidales bacterium]|nr:SusC/RagA family TonB-linked outer membrane protein [Bacteroidales bacterium]
MKRLLIITWLLLSVMATFAQDKTITGQVKGEKGEPLGFVTVIEESSTNGTITDENGKFSLKVSSLPTTIKLAYLGFEEQIVNVTEGKTNYSINMLLDAEQLEEVVVVAYGEQKKVSITGSISSVNNEALKSSPTSSVVNSLMGNIAGLSAWETDGRPGDNFAELNIRGTSSFNNNSPLVLVDGIERSFNEISSDEIENISVLKDASATALYGVRGANGVILVTTKRGREGKPKFSFSSQVGVTELDRFVSKLEPYQVAIAENDFQENRGASPKWTAYDIERFEKGDRQSTHFTGDAYDLLKRGMKQKYNMNVSGGTERVKYFVSLGYYTETGNYQTDLGQIYSQPYMQQLFEENPNSYENIVRRNYEPDFGYDRINFRSNIDIKLSNSSDLSVNLGYMTSEKVGPGGPDGGDKYAAFYGVKLGYSWVLPNGTFGTTQGRTTNPLESINYQGYINNFTSLLEGTLSYKLSLDKLTKGLKVGVKTAYDVTTRSKTDYTVGYPLYRYNRFTNQYEIQNNSKRDPRYISTLKGQESNVYAELRLNYNRRFGNHDLSGLLLGNYNAIRKPNLKNDKFGNIPQVFQGLVARINYGYADKYLAEVNFGYNGSNRFAVGKRYALFPA